MSPARTRALRPAAAPALDAFRRILRALRLAARETLATGGLSPAQLYVLQSLSDGTEASLNELAAATMTDRSSVAAVVERLYQSGYVRRGTSTVDRRRAAITITASGRSVLRKSPTPPTAVLVRALGALPAAQLAALGRGLTALADRMGVGDEPAGMLFEDAAGDRLSTARRKSRRAAPGRR